MEALLPICCLHVVERLALLESIHVLDVVLYHSVQGFPHEGVMLPLELLVGLVELIGLDLLLLLLLLSVNVQTLHLTVIWGDREPLERGKLEIIGGVGGSEFGFGLVEVVDHPVEALEELHGREVSDPGLHQKLYLRIG